MLTSRMSALTTALFVIVVTLSSTPTAMAQGVPENALFEIGSADTTPPPGIEALPVDMWTTENFISTASIGPTPATQDATRPVNLPICLQGTGWEVGVTAVWIEPSKAS